MRELCGDGSFATARGTYASMGRSAGMRRAFACRRAGRGFATSLAGSLPCARRADRAAATRLDPRQPLGQPPLSSFRFRSIGPAAMGGRVDDIAVAPSNHSVIYIGYATGGVFRSVNAGTTFEPVFERYGSASIGALAIDPTNPDVVYVGTGEPNNRQTSSFGDGLYKSTDGGKTFANIGLRETQTIARIVIDPKHPEVVYVAVPGHLFGPSPDRGVYKTTDGGKTWNKIKYIDENTGFTDIAMDPKDPSTLYAASYQRRRSGCCFNGGGPGSALWKTDNGGKSWTKLTGGGLPPGTYGRIALDVSRSNPNVVYAQIETDGGATTPAGAAWAGGGGGRGGYDWCNNGAPRAANDTTKPPALSAERSGIFRSENKGRSWTAVSNCNNRPLYFSQLRIDPDERPAHLRRRRPHGEVGRRRPDVQLPRPRARLGQSGRGPARVLDRPVEPRSHPARHGRGVHGHVRPGRDVGIRAHDGDEPRVLGQRGHVASVQRLFRPAGQRQLGRAERDAKPRGDPEPRVVPLQRRRRLPDRGESERSARRVRRVAGGEHVAHRPRHWPVAEHSSRRASVPRGAEVERPSESCTRRRVRGRPDHHARRRRPRRGWRRRRTRRRSGERPQRGARRRVPLQLEHAAPCSRRTTRTSSGSAAIACSGRTTRAITGSRAPTSRNTSTAATSS